jgi:hypothetical protein
MELGLLIVYPIAIKAILSSIKYGFAELSSNVFKISAIVLGVASGFLVDNASFLLPVSTTGVFSDILGHVMTGLIIGISAMGVHDVSQIITTGKKTTPSK